MLERCISSAAVSIKDVALWYHTLELPDGGVTPGWFDLRPVVERLPWPAIEGMRCLDVGTYDGFWAFELERRGASEVVATDIAGNADWDFPDHARELAAERLDRLAGEKGRGFDAARQALGSKVQKEVIGVHELSPERVGAFDFVFCGSLLLHLRDPVAALEAIRSVCRGSFLSVEEVSLWLSLRHPRRPLAEMRLDARLGQWLVPNAAGHVRMLELAGFRVERRTRPFSEPFGSRHPPRARGLSAGFRRMVRRLITGADGVPHAAALAVPNDAPTQARA